MIVNHEPFINIKLVAIFITNIVDRYTSTHIIVEILSFEQKPSLPTIFKNKEMSKDIKFHLLNCTPLLEAKENIYVREFSYHHGNNVHTNK